MGLCPHCGKAVNGHSHPEKAWYDDGREIMLGGVSVEDYRCSMCQDVLASGDLMVMCSWCKHNPINMPSVVGEQVSPVLSRNLEPDVTRDLLPGDEVALAVDPLIAEPGYCFVSIPDLDFGTPLKVYLPPTTPSPVTLTDLLDIRKSIFGVKLLPRFYRIYHRHKHSHLSYYP